MEILAKTLGTCDPCFSFPKKSKYKKIKKCELSQKRLAALAAEKQIRAL